MKIFRSLISYFSARKVRSTKKMASLVLNVNLKDKIKNLQKNLLTILNKKKLTQQQVILNLENLTLLLQLWTQSSNFGCCIAKCQ